jgi:hypothetical protein
MVRSLLRRGSGQGGSLGSAKSDKPLEPTERPSKGRPQTPNAHQANPPHDDLQISDRQRDELERVLDNYAALLHDTGRDIEAEELEARARTLHAGEGSEK